MRTGKLLSNRICRSNAMPRWNLWFIPDSRHRRVQWELPSRPHLSGGLYIGDGRGTMSGRIFLCRRSLQSGGLYSGKLPRRSGSDILQILPCWNGVSQCRCNELY